MLVIEMGFQCIKVCLLWISYAKVRGVQSFIDREYSKPLGETDVHILNILIINVYLLCKILGC